MLPDFHVDPEMPHLYESKEYSPIVTGISVHNNNRFPIVVLLLALVLTWGCSATDEIVQSPPAEQPPAPDPTTWNSSPNPDKALEYFIVGSIKEENGDFAGARDAFEKAVVHDIDPSIFSALARSHVHTGDAYTALVFAREAVHGAPGKIEYRRQLAQLYMLLGENDSAAVQLMAVIEQDPTDRQAQYSLAQMYDGSDPAKAIQLYEDLRERMGDDWNLSTRLAELYSQQNRLPEATKELETLLRLDPDNAVVMQTLGSLSIQLRDYDRALEMYVALSERDPQNVSYRLGIAEIYLHKKNWEAASQSMRMALGMQALSMEDALRIGEIYFQQAVANASLTMEALDAILQLKALYPDEWKPSWYLGALMFNYGSYEPAIRHFNDALRINPGNAQTLDVLARAYMAIGKYEEVIPTLRRLIVTGEAKAVSYQQLAYAYNRLGRNDDALTAYQQAVMMDPASIDAASQLALMYEERNEFGKSQDIYDRTIEAYQERNQKRTNAYYVMLNNYAYSLSERGIQLDRALELARQAVTKDPENSSFLDTIGWIHFKTGNMNEARMYLEKAVSVSEQQGAAPSAVLYHHLGDVYLALGNEPKAKENWEKALAKSPDNKDLQRKLQRDPQ